MSGAELTRQAQASSALWDVRLLEVLAGQAVSETSVAALSAGSLVLVDDSPHILSEFTERWKRYLGESNPVWAYRTRSPTDTATFLGIILERLRREEVQSAAERAELWLKYGSD